MAPLSGLEPEIYSLEDCCIIQLCYRGFKLDSEDGMEPCTHHLLSGNDNHTTLS